MAGRTDGTRIICLKPFVGLQAQKFGGVFINARPGEDLAIRRASDATPLFVPCDAVRAVLRARTGGRGLRQDGAFKILHRHQQKEVLVFAETCRQFLRVKHSTPLRQTPL